MYLVKIHPRKVKAHQLDQSKAALSDISVLPLYLMSPAWSLVINAGVLTGFTAF